MPSEVVNVCTSPHQADVTGLAYCPSSGLLYSSGGDTKIKVWDKDLNVKNEVQIVEEGIWIYCIAVDLQGRVYAGSNDGSIRLLTDPLLGTETKKILENSEEILSMSCDGNRVYAGDDKGAIVCLVNENFICRIETSESVNCVFAEGDLLYSIRDRDLSINWIVSRKHKVVHNIASRAVIPGRSPITLFGKLIDGHRQLIGLVERDGKNFSVYENKECKSFIKYAQAPFDAHELIINAICGTEDNVIFTADYGGKIKKWTVSNENISLVDEIDASPGSCINAIVALDAHTMYCGSSDGVLRKIRL